VTWVTAAEELPKKPTAQSKGDASTDTSFKALFFGRNTLPQQTPDPKKSRSTSFKDIFFGRETLPQLPVEQRKRSATSFRELFLTIDTLPQDTNSLPNSGKSLLTWFMSREKLPSTQSGATAASTTTRR
jgi:hypothetical protein